MPKAQDWSLTAGSIELGVGIKTLTKRVDEAGIEPVRIQERNPGDIKFYLMADLSKALHGFAADDDEEVAEEMAAVKLANEKQLLRTRTRINDEEEGLLVPTREFAETFSKWSRLVGMEYDSLEGQLAETGRECPECKNKMLLDGRGRQRIRDTIIRCKNHLAGLHRKLFNDDEIGPPAV